MTAILDDARKRPPVGPTALDWSSAALAPLALAAGRAALAALTPPGDGDDVDGLVADLAARFAATADRQARKVLELAAAAPVLAGTPVAAGMAGGVIEDMMTAAAGYAADSAALAIELVAYDTTPEGDR